MRSGELAFFSKYPFLAHDRHLEGIPSAQELINDERYDEARQLGAERVLGALRGIGPKSKGTGMSWLLSYPVSRVLVSSINDPYLIRRYALMEAKQAYAQLLSEDDQVLGAIAQGLGLDARRSRDYRWSMGFVDYIGCAAGMGGRWKLANRDLAMGRVSLTKHDVCRVMQEAVRRRIERELPLAIPPTVKNKLGDSAQSISSELGEMKQRWGPRDGAGRGGGAGSVLRLPPCMKRLLRMVQSGENVPHMGRFALTTFLHALGSSPQDVVALFGTSADFDEERTKYQVEHIMGKISGTEYTPPSCETMRTYGLCWEPDELCERVKHPLSYYRRKRKFVK